MKKHLNRSEFDFHASSYNEIIQKASFFSSHSYFARYKVNLIKNISRGNFHNILDFGCGIGRNLQFLSETFKNSNIYGFDPSVKSIRVAKKNKLKCFLFSDWKKKPSVKFDLILIANVMHHIDPSEHLRYLRICLKSLSKDGEIYIFEHNPRNLFTKHVFENCVLDKDASMLDMKYSLGLIKKSKSLIHSYGYSLFIPFPYPGSTVFEYFFRRVPLGSQYFIRFGKA